MPVVASLGDGFWQGSRFWVSCVGLFCGRDILRNEPVGSLALTLASTLAGLLHVPGPEAPATFGCYAS